MSLTGKSAAAALRQSGPYASLGAALAAARHAVEKIDPAAPLARGAEYFAANPGQHLRTWISNEGIELASGSNTPEGTAPWSVKLRLRGIGRGETMAAVAAGGASGKGNRVEIEHHATAVTQWFENLNGGLEQGFTLHTAPAGTVGEVVILLDRTGTLQPLEMGDRTGVSFADAAGKEMLHYSGLRAWDAAKRPLAARMEVRTAGALALIVADAGARYPVTIDPLFANVEARLVEESVAYDSFGSSVALCGDTALVGAPYDDTAAGFDAGSAYVFVRDGALWTQQAKLSAGDAAAYDYFGSAVALAGDTALVGARGDAKSAGSDAGSAYVFTRDGSTWVQQAKLTAADAAEGDRFGAAVALAGDTALIGAWGDDTAAGTNAGSAYAFVRSGTGWSQQAKLSAGDAEADDNFGNAVALSGDTALIGAWGDDTAAAMHAGSAYVFVRSETTWVQQAKLSRTEAAGDDNFGSAVALAGDTALIGTWKDDTLTAQDAGSAYVFVRAAGVWVQQAKLTTSDAAADDRFGASVALSDTTALVGANGCDTTAGMHAGASYIFRRDGTAWAQQAKLTANDAAQWDKLGFAVAISGDTALVGAPDDATASGSNAGSAYVFGRSAALWVQQAKLTANDGAADDRFGTAVALAGATALIGASLADTAAGADAGSAYLFVRGGAAWGQLAKLTAADAAPGDAFGSAVALAAESALVGAPYAGTAALTHAGAAYVFARGGGAWSQQAKLSAGDAAPDDRLGSAVALTEGTALLGADGADTAAGPNAGSAYVFLRSGTAWSQQAKLSAGDASGYDRFGSAVAISGDTALIGARADDTASGTDVGSAYAFVRSGTAWSQQAKLTASDAEGAESFGSSVALSGDTALVGAPNDATPAGVASGSAYAFTRNGTTWVQQARLSAGLDASAYDLFGASVALAGDTALVGAPYDDTMGLDAGNAHVFLLGDLPEITVQPQSRTVVPGQAATFILTATGYQQLRYQWRKDGYEISGASGTSYTIPSARVADQGSYDCVVSNIGGTATSAAAQLRVNALSEFTRIFPGPPAAAMGYVFVTLTPSGVGGWRFAGEQQWRASGVPVSGLTTSDRVIECMPVNGYIQPPAEPVSVISGGAPTFITLPYYPTGQSGGGGLCVILKPDSIAAPGQADAERAQWRLFKPGINYDPWLNSGDLLGGLIAGSYLVECKPVAGRSTPPPGIVRVVDGPAVLATITYFLEEAPAGAAPLVLPFETVTTSDSMPYAYVGQIRSDAGSSSGFVVKPRVVATAGHVVFDDGTLSAVTGLQWLFQRDSTSHEPKPQIPRGIYLLDDYAAARAEPGVVPGEGTLESQNRDAAALYFLADASRGGYGGFLASDAADNEFLVSSAQKTLVGYPVDNLAGFIPGRMHATAPMNVRFTRVAAVDESGSPFRTYKSADIRGSGGISGGPLCVQFEGGNYYPAAIYLGGSGQAVVRSIDSKVVDVFSRAELSSIAGDNNTGGGITFTSFSSIGGTEQPGALQVKLEPAEARALDARWSLESDPTLRLSEARKVGINPGSYVVQLTTVSGYQVPAEQTVTIMGGKLLEITYTYLKLVAPPAITSANSVTATRGQMLIYRVTADPTADSYSLAGSLPTGLTFDPASGLISGTLGQAGVFSVTVGATNTGGTDTQSLTLTSYPSLSNQGTTVPLDQPLDFQIASSESGTGVTFAATGLPPGVLLDPGSGRLAGSPQQAGVFAAALTLAKAGASASATFTLTVTATPLEIWRLDHFATTTNAGSAADSADPDGDGQPNISEYAAGTGPNNGSDFFHVLTASKNAASYAATVAGKAERAYVLERRADLGVGEWTSVATVDPLGADGTVTLIDPAPAPDAGFYRVRVTAP